MLCQCYVNVACVIVSMLLLRWQAGAGAQAAGQRVKLTVVHGMVGSALLDMAV